MTNKPTYEELEQRVKELEQEEAERKQAEEALQESKERFRAIFETAQDSIFIKDRDLHTALLIQAWNVFLEFQPHSLWENLMRNSLAMMLAPISER